MIQKSSLLLFILLFTSIGTIAQDSEDTLLPIRGLCIAAPNPDGVARFLKFIDEELAPRKLNT